jgi:hypothetical protein
MHMTRFLKSLAVLTLAAGPLLSLGGSGAAIAATAAPAVLPTPTNSFQMITEGGYCLDANASGSTAGNDGDAVTLWTCTGGTNQLWHQGRSDVDGYNTLVNNRWPNECLNVDNSGGERNGSKVQLWHCSITTSNEFWGTREWMICLRNQCNPKDITNEGGAGLSTPVLDAVSQHIGNGDKVQVWQPNGGANQSWT